MSAQEGAHVDPGRVTALHHLGMVVDDLDAAIGFYTTELGFTCRSTADWTVVDGRALNIPHEHVRLRWAFLELGGVRFELHEFDGEERSTKPRRTADRGLGHLAFAVPDADAARGRLERAGVVFHSEPNLLSGIPGQEGDRWLYGTDPFGLLIELYESAGTTRTGMPGAADEKRDEKPGEGARAEGEGTP